jgi:hypothetical protein
MGVTRTGDINLNSKGARGVTEGTLGDKLGVEKYSIIESSKSEELSVFCNFYRRAWARKYIRWIGKDRLQVMGYSEDTLLNRINRSTGQKYILRDIMEVSFQFLKALLPLRRLTKSSISSKSFVELR